MRRLAGVLLLVAAVGCGPGKKPASPETGSPDTATNGGPSVTSASSSVPAGSATAPGEAPEVRPNPAPAVQAGGDPVATLEKLGARMKRNERGEIISVDLGSTKAGDADLARVKELPSLRVLHLFNTRIGDAGLTHLQGLTQLQELGLGRTRITDAGLVHLAGLTGLRTLDFSWCVGVKGTGLQHIGKLTGLQDLSFYKTRLTDEVLKHLEGLSGLQNLTLPDPGTSEAAVAKLRKVLTKCEITKLDY